MASAADIHIVAEAYPVGKTYPPTGPNISDRSQSEFEQRAEILKVRGGRARRQLETTLLTTPLSRIPTTSPLAYPTSSISPVPSSPGASG